MITDYDELERRFEELKGYFDLPGVIERSVHYLRGGTDASYYSNFDIVANDPVRLANILEYYVRIIEEIALEEPIDYLVFIEKQPGGTVGAIRLAAALSIRLGIPNIVVRQSLEVLPERVKMVAPRGEPAMRKLEATNVVLLTDHITHGGEVIRALESLEALGARVPYVVTYTLKLAKFRNSLDEFAERGTNIYTFFNLYEEGDSLEFTTGGLIIPGEEKLYGGD